MSNRSQRQINLFFANLIAKIRKWLIKIGSPFRISRRFVRSLFAQSRGQGKGKRGTQAGFVLPTVVMVTTVVTLLVVLMVARSSERARTASNARVEQAVRLATTPAVDRARIKIDALMNEPSLGRGAPPDATLYDTIKSSERYTFNDEIRLQLLSEPTVSVSSSTDAYKISNTAWKYPIDTDNNGLFDSMAIYSIQFRARPQNATTRDVAVTEARTPPMDENNLTGECQFDAGGGQASGWFNRGSKLKKAFFVYAATVPITQLPMPGVATADAGKYEVYKGNQGFSALELQQDRAREGLNNTSVWFENDLELSQAPTFRLNGKVFTNANLMIGARPQDTTQFYQISSPFSCQYKEENSQVLVAGNVVFGDAMTIDTNAIDPVDFDLFQGETNPPIVDTAGTKINDGTKTVDNTGPEAASNDFAYTKRLDALVQAALVRTATPKYPDSVQDDIDTNGVTEADALRTYFKNRLRKVPFKEVAFGSTDSVILGGWTPDPGIKDFLAGSGGTYSGSSVNSGNGVVDIGGNKIEFIPPEKWIIPPYNGAPSTYLPGQGVSFPTDSANLTFATDNLPATDPEFRKSNFEKQDRLGDRILVGNNLPAFWYKSDEANKFADKTIDYKLGDNIKWSNDPTKQRTINTRVDTLADLGDPGRGDYWEKQAAASPTSADDPSNIDDTNRRCNTAGSCNEISPVRGGLRVITGAGIFSRQTSQSFLPVPPSLASATNTKTDVIAGLAVDETKFNADSTSSDTALKAGFVVWPDSMPMTGAVRWSGSAYQRWDGTAWTTTGGSDTDYSNPLNGSGVAKKGDLQMRATAVYHYKTSVYDPLTPGTYQRPIACVSSYYDPSDEYSARNGLYGASPTALPDVSGLVDSDRNGTFDLLANGQPIPSDMALGSNTARGRSNNGVTYAVGQTAASITGTIGYDGAAGTRPGFFNVGSGNYGEPNPVGTTTNLAARLVYQANLVYPNGRFVNPQLRSALYKAVTTGSGSIAAGQLSLSEQAAVDSSLCALQILDGALTVNPIPVSGVNVPHGTFKEATFLDGREVKSLNQDESLSGTDPSLYDLEIEQRQPIEIRATDIDFNLLRSNTVTGSINNDSTNGIPTEYLLPYSGVVYASRDDALEDLSDSSTTLDSREQLSPTDFLLDPTHRPSSIRLINGSRLWRGGGTTQPNWTIATRGEKGLVFVSNLPVYIKGDFNRHTQEEFETALAADWDNFYDRNDINDNFACRPNSPKTDCTTGDEWRAATIIADAPTVVSANSVDGFRIDGDFDLRNNADTSSVSSTVAQSRLKTAGLWNNNFVTNTDYLNGNNISTGGSPELYADVFPGDRKTTYLANGTTPVQRRGNSYEYSMEICRKLPASECGPNDWTGVGAGTTVMPTLDGTPTAAEPWGTGTNATPSTSLRYIHPDDLRFPRRVHFMRSSDLFDDGSKALVFTSTCSTAQASYPIPIGVTNGNAATGGKTFGYLNTASACEASASSASAAESSASSASVSSASASSASSSSSASRSSASSVGVSASTSSRSSSSASTASSSDASASASSASSASRSSASAASAISASASRSSASSGASSVSASSRSASASASSASASSASASSVSAASAASSRSASASSVSSAASSVSASSISRSASRSSASLSSASSASIASRSASSASSASISSASSAASSVSASSVSRSASASSASLSSASAASLVSRSASSASSASLSSASAASLSASRASVSSASSASVASASASRSLASSASSASLSASSASSSSRSASSASSSSASSSSLSASSASSASRSAASSSVASSISSSVASSRSRAGAMLRPLTIAAISKPSLAIASGGTVPRLPIAAMLPRVNLDLGNPLAALYTGPKLDGTSAAKDARSAPAQEYLGMTSATNTFFGKTTPATVARALWYRVVGDPNDDITGGSTAVDALGDPAKVRYDASTAERPLYIYTAAPGPGNSLSKTAAPKVLLPDTLNFNVASNIGEVSSSGTYSLNATAAKSASDYAICTTGAGSYLNRARTTAEIKGSPTNSCDGLTQATTFLGGLRAITSEGTVSQALKTTRVITKTSVTTEEIGLTEADGYPNVSVVVVNLPATIATTSDVTLTLKDTRTTKPKDTMFVLKLPNSTTIGSDGTDKYGLKMKLNGVSPNNIFWVVGDNSSATLTLKNTFKTGDASGNAIHRTVLMGNFIGDGAAPTIENNVEIRNGRFLGFSSAPVVKFNNGLNSPAEAGHDADGDANAAIVAMTSDAEPLVLPVLQVQAPEVAISAAGTTNLAQDETTGATNDEDARWVEVAANTEVNAYFVAGNTPSRAFVPYSASTNPSGFTAETSGGLHNFIRYMQSWRNITSRISGGFIQSRRSVFATAPFSSTAPYKDLALAQNNASGNSTAITSLFGAASDGITRKYYQSLTNQALPFYRPPQRQWGYDVGLLTQPSDLFALRFSKASPDPNEFFREVGKDDKYIQNLLCALQPANATTAVNDSARKGTGTDAEIADYTVLALPDYATSCPPIPTSNPYPTYNP